MAVDLRRLLGHEGSGLVWREHRPALVNPEYYPAVKVASLPRGGRGHFTALWFGRMGGPILAHRWAINTILGESYCQWIEDVPAFEDATNFCIREKLQSMWSKAFWTNIVIAFLNRRPTLRENIRFFGTPLHSTTTCRSSLASARACTLVRKCGERARRLSRRPWSSVIAAVELA